MHTLHVIRHGEAEARASSDEKRPLTPYGSDQVSRNASQNLTNNHYDYVFVSPYLRAQQTWSIIQTHNVTFKQCHTVDWVTPDVPTQPVLDRLVLLEGDSLNILIVCHQTFVGRLATHLCGGPTHGIHVDTAAILHMETEVFAAKCGRLIATYSE